MREKVWTWPSAQRWLTETAAPALSSLKRVNYLRETMFQEVLASCLFCAAATTVSKREWVPIDNIEGDVYVDGGALDHEGNGLALQIVSTTCSPHAKIERDITELIWERITQKHKKASKTCFLLVFVSQEDWELDCSVLRERLEKSAEFSAYWLIAPLNADKYPYRFIVDCFSGLGSSGAIQFVIDFDPREGPLRMQELKSYKQGISLKTLLTST